MKCMAELLEMREIAIEEERIRQLELDRKAQEDFLFYTAKTIEFCETVIAPTLEEIAIKTIKDIKVNFKTTSIDTDRLGNEFFQLLKSEGCIYADYRESFTPHGDWISVEVLKTYLEKHCIKCELSPMEYWQYGCGCHKGFNLKIYI